MVARALGIGSTVVLCLCLYLWTAVLVLRPIESIHGRLRAFLKHGTLNAPVQPFRARELAGLYDSIDLLAASLAEREERNTALSAANEREWAAKVEALSTAKIKADFLANISHELRTPLNGVLGMLQLLEASQLADVERCYVRTAHESGQLLLRLIGDVLDFVASLTGYLRQG